MNLNSRSFFLIATFLLVSTTFCGCGAIFRQAEKLSVREPESDLPRDMVSPDEDYDLQKDTSCVVQLHDDSGAYVIGKEQIASDRIGDKIREMLDVKTPDKRIVYIKSGVDVHYGTIVSLLDLVRKAEVDRAGFVALRKGDKMSVRPARFQVKLGTGPARLEPRELRPMPSGNRPLTQDRRELRRIDRGSKPDPLTLVVALDPSLKLTINNEPFGDVYDTDILIAKLRDIFKERAANGVFREGTNEVEQTVWIKAPRSVRYGDVMKVIDAVKAAGAAPIGMQLDDLVE